MESVTAFVGIGFVQLTIQFELSTSDSISHSPHNCPKISCVILCKKSKKKNPKRNFLNYYY